MKIFNNKITKIFLIVVAAALFFGIFGGLGYSKFHNWKFVRDMRKEAAKFEKMQEEREKAIAADTYGGKTPQETLDLFIAAVEKGDYELASKYFVVERQEEELGQLKKSDIKDIGNVMSLLKIAKSKMSKENKTSKDTYIINDPILVTFVKYPSGNWKIDEI